MNVFLQNLQNWGQTDGQHLRNKYPYRRLIRLAVNLSCFWTVARAGSAFQSAYSSCSDGGFTALNNWINWINLDSKKFGHQNELRYNFELWKSIKSTPCSSVSTNLCPCAKYLWFMAFNWTRFLKMNKEKTSSAMNYHQSYTLLTKLLGLIYDSKK